MLFVCSGSHLILSYLKVRYLRNNSLSFLSCNTCYSCMVLKHRYFRKQIRNTWNEPVSGCVCVCVCVCVRDGVSEEWDSECE